MTSNDRRFFSGGSLEQAIMQAARHYGVEPQELVYKPVEKRHGFLRARRGAVIEVDPSAPRRDKDAEKPDPAEPTAAEPMTEVVEDQASTGATASQEDDELEDENRLEEEQGVEGTGDDEPEQGERLDLPLATGELADAARESLDDILEFAGVKLESKVMQGDGQLEIELWGADRQILIEDRGNLLLAIQHLLPRMIRGRAGETIPCHVDSESFHENRRVELEAMALKVAREVCEKQRPSTLPAMNPAERRIIHLSLADDAEVVTESDGRGFFKRVTIRPAMRRPRGFDPY